MGTDVSRLIVVAAAVALAAQAPSPKGRRVSTGATPAYLLLELPSGRTLAESRRAVLDTPVAPGSIAKLATLAAALETGVVTDRTRILCRRRADTDGHVVECVHPDLRRPLDAVEALGYSCNGYVASIARTLDRGALNRTLARLGLPTLDPATPTVTGALGLAGIKATPRQLLEAFLRIAGSSRVAIRLDDRHRAVLRRGMELAAWSGTASALAEAGFRGMAKTGTAPMPGGGYEGLVTALVDTERPTHALVVVAPGASGAHAAELAAGILKQHGAPYGTARSPVPSAVEGQRASSVFRVGITQRNGSHAVEEMEAETYVGRAVAGEGGDSLPPAALEALAIAARTFAEASRGRHSAEGFDLCDLTHCLALRQVSSRSLAAAAATRGLVLFDGPHLADVYLSASCGGHTERPSVVWASARDVAYLSARPDPACASEPGWESRVPEVRLRRVLQAAGLRGGPVRDLRVADRTSSGRARRLKVEGMVPELVDAGAFRLAAGRTLGWQTIKSALFDIRRTSDGYRFVGKGMGHGVGMCVRGAANRSAGGASREAILAFYFPGLRIGSTPASVRVVLPEEDRDALATVRRSVAAALDDLARKLGVTESPEVEIRFHPTVDAYARATGLPWWTSARTSGARIDLLPLGVLRKRSTLESTLRHELVHVLTDEVLRDRPLWVREGLAQVIAGEAPPATKGSGAGACPGEDELRAPRSPDAWRDAYAGAARCVAAALAKGQSWRELR
ncbi:MAG: SpoIID/LytB domain-containing protein [Acidobacteriota bacterium]